MAESVASISSFRKYGIPESKDPDLTLLERLVWVKYQSLWWPAVLFHSYSELQQHLYDKLDTNMKAQFAMAIMRQLQDKRTIKVARLLGRPILEITEVKKGTYYEFYYQLPNILPQATNRSLYGDNIDLYYDFHRAMDQVEDVIREASDENFGAPRETWLKRAQKSSGSLFDAAADEDSNIFFTAMDSVMESISSSFDGAAQKNTEAPSNMEEISSVAVKNRAKVIFPPRTNADNAQAILKKTMGAMDSHRQDEPVTSARELKLVETVLSENREEQESEGNVEASLQERTPEEFEEIALQRADDNATFWQFMTCQSG